MILIGQYDSPFVRRVGIALTLYGIAFEHRPWSTFGDAGRIRPLSPLTRVPVLLVDGVALTDSHLILAQLDELAPPGTALMPADPVHRLAARQLVGLATGMAETAVSLFYEKILHDHPSPLLIERRGAQVTATAAVLETAAATAATPFLCGAAITHADIALAAAVRFVTEAHPGLLDPVALPALTRRCRDLEAMEAFQAIQQPFIPPS
ncbi:glutathione S-transferase family protein [Roseomonas sp. JC162]|uniref:Glutathione S-transferase family protein n=1 Tax=Neoroseomonas marina TaxID=1232220 RepID=A0A848EFI3_9PROT|nr:glutathione S-transferase family protein [Neoroseomonas marina]NMJ42329.1 glutathione S-transferase family protein [Neoroseomonas marina]